MHENVLYFFAVILLNNGSCGEISHESFSLRYMAFQIYEKYIIHSYIQFAETCLRCTCACTEVRLPCYCCHAQ